ncbi:hypothetical protein ACFQX8_27775 [Klenkia terrae]|uniref:hypothetical protein n=1 Tax=Klenkia terrae TaxID=1052259 RepID=UPI00361C7E61
MPRGSRGYRYGRWRGGEDPLAPPYDLGDAVDEIGDQVLAGSSVREALRDLLRRGLDGRRGLDDLRRSVRDRLRRAREAGSMDGTLTEVRELLDRALEAERRELFPDPDDAARLAEAELDALPEDTAGAVRALKDRQWRSPEAAEAYRQIQDLLQKEVLDSQFQHMKQALQQMNAEGQDGTQAVKDMVADLSALLDAHNRGEDTDQRFADFMDKHGQFFPDDPQTVEELVDSLARRAAAQERMMAGLSPSSGPSSASSWARPCRTWGWPRRWRTSTTHSGRPAPTCRGADRARCPTGTRAWAWATPRPPWPSWPTWRRCPASCPRATRGPASPTSTRSWSSARSAGPGSTTSPHCAGSSASSSGRAT